MLARADELAAGGAVEGLQLALHLLDLVVFAGGPDTQEARRRKADVLERRAKAERSFVARNVLRSAATIEREQVC